MRNSGGNTLNGGKEVNDSGGALNVTEASNRVSIILGINVLLSEYKDIYEAIKKIYEDDRDMESASEEEKKNIAQKSVYFLKSLRGMSEKDIQGIHYFVLQQLQHLLNPMSQIGSLIEEEKDNTEEYLKTFYKENISERLSSKDFYQSVENLFYFYENFENIFGSRTEAPNGDLITELGTIISTCDKLELEIIGDIPRNFDRTILYVFFQNLISNYKKYGKEGKVSIDFGEDSYNLSLENTKKSQEETSQMYSGGGGTKIMNGIVEYLGMKNDAISIEDKKDIYTMSVSEIPFQT